MAKAKKDKTEEKEKKKEKKVTIKSRVRELFTEDPNIETTDMIEEICNEFPDSRFDKSHVAYYRNYFRKKENMDIPLRRKPKADKDAKPKKAKKATAKKSGRRK